MKIDERKFRQIAIILGTQGHYKDVSIHDFTNEDMAQFEKQGWQVFDVSRDDNTTFKVAKKKFLNTQFTLFA